MKRTLSAAHRPARKAGRQLSVAETLRALSKTRDRERAASILAAALPVAGVAVPEFVAKHLGPLGPFEPSDDAAAVAKMAAWLRHGELRKCKTIQSVLNAASQLCKEPNAASELCMEPPQLADSPHSARCHRAEA
jgi:hypothetical protein